MQYYLDIAEAIRMSHGQLKHHGREVPHAHWQGIPVDDLGGSEWHHLETLNVGFVCPMPESAKKARALIRPNLPWAEDHFQERVAGKPLNPGYEYQNWPHWTAQSEQVLNKQGQFTHTYMERFWPKYAAYFDKERAIEEGHDSRRGIRYHLGDLNDVVNLLLRDPYTRQAYLPVFFPEDTGAVHEGRIPCTLGYHFMLRDGRFHLWYEIRSCDLFRHFLDDLYMAVRLAQWVRGQLREKFDAEATEDSVVPRNFWRDAAMGEITFLAHSFHCFMGDRHAL